VVCVWQVYTRLNERLGLADHLLVLNVMLTKIGTNLKVFGSCEDVVEQTLTLFQARACAVLVWQRQTHQTLFLFVTVVTRKAKLRHPHCADARSRGTVLLHTHQLMTAGSSCRTTANAFR